MVMDVSENIFPLRSVKLPHVAVGALAAFIGALAVIGVFLAFVIQHSLVPFAWYRRKFGFACADRGPRHS